jgi:Holliday junction resolvase-like predicted endonuclease
MNESAKATHDSAVTILKSSRHAKITGDFGEVLVLYWLSKYGFECARVDHTGIDIIARNPHTQELMGISVKSRSRNVGTEQSSLRISADNFEKARAACDAFSCTPYFAIVIDAGTSIRAFLLSMEHLLTLHSVGKTSASWKMGEKYLSQYANDSEIKTFELQTATPRWWTSE